MDSFWNKSIKSEHPWNAVDTTNTLTIIKYLKQVEYCCETK